MVNRLFIKEYLKTLISLRMPEFPQRLGLNLNDPAACNQLPVAVVADNLLQISDSLSYAIPSSP